MEKGLKVPVIKDKDLRKQDQEHGSCRMAEHF